MSDVVLSVRNLYKEFPNKLNPKALRAGVRGVNLEVSRGEVVGLIGESGCGKTTLGRCIARLINPDSGQIIVNGKDFGAMSGETLRMYRKHVQVVFQRPETCLNPRMSVYQFINEAFRNFHTCERGGERDKIIQFSRMVGLKEDAVDYYPHQLSGGEKQRVAIMRALACDPSVIILDEPTSALDVSVQAQVLKTLKELQRDVQTGFLFISHDVAVIRYMCSRVMVMYLGVIVEEGPADLVFTSPRHPYTRALLAAVPRLSQVDRSADKLRGELIMSDVTPEVCPLLPRCLHAHDKCKTRPPMFDLEQGHRASCWMLE
ncbi:MAG: ABC transporter ATP-binding protein [Chloroflexi bacterium]|nr:ABC transporter ATP-binding protein [Chloroflexota bacterium]